MTDHHLPIPVDTGTGRDTTAPGDIDDNGMIGCVSAGGSGTGDQLDNHSHFFRPHHQHHPHHDVVSASSSSSARRRDTWDNSPPRKRRLKQDYHESDKTSTQLSSQKVRSRTKTSNKKSLTSSSSIEECAVRGYMMNITTLSPQVVVEDHNDNATMDKSYRKSLSFLPPTIFGSLAEHRCSKSQSSLYLTTTPTTQESESESESESSDRSTIPPPLPGLRRQQVRWNVHTENQRKYFDRQKSQVQQWVDKIQSDNHRICSQSQRLLVDHPECQSKQHRRQQDQRRGHRRGQSSSVAFSTIIEGIKMSPLDESTSSISPIPINYMKFHQKMTTTTKTTQQKQQQQQECDFDGIDNKDYGRNDGDHESSSSNRTPNTPLASNRYTTVMENFFLCQSPATSSLPLDDDVDHHDDNENQAVDIHNHDIWSNLGNELRAEQAGLGGTNSISNNGISHRAVSSTDPTAGYTTATSMNIGPSFPSLLINNCLPSYRGTAASDTGQFFRNCCRQSQDFETRRVYPNLPELDLAADEKTVCNATMNVRHEFDDYGIFSNDNMNRIDGGIHEVDQTSNHQQQSNVDRRIYSNDDGNRVDSGSNEMDQSSNHQKSTFYVSEIWQALMKSDPTSIDEPSGLLSKNLAVGTSALSAPRILFPTSHKKKRNKKKNGAVTFTSTGGGSNSYCPAISVQEELPNDVGVTERYGYGMRDRFGPNMTDAGVPAAPRPPITTFRRTESFFVPRTPRKASSINSVASNGTKASNASNDSVPITPPSTSSELKVDDSYHKIDDFMDTHFVKDNLFFLSESLSTSRTANDRNDTIQVLRRRTMQDCDSTKMDLLLLSPASATIGPRASSRIDERGVVVDQQPLNLAILDQACIDLDVRSTIKADRTTHPASSSVASATLKDADMSSMTTEQVQIKLLTMIADDAWPNKNNDENDPAITEALHVINIPPKVGPDFGLKKQVKKKKKYVETTLDRSYGLKDQHQDKGREIPCTRYSGLVPSRGRQGNLEVDFAAKTAPSEPKTQSKDEAESSNEIVSAGDQLQLLTRRCINDATYIHVESTMDTSSDSELGHNETMGSGVSQGKPASRCEPRAMTREDHDLALSAAVAAGLLPSTDRLSFLSSRQSSSAHQEDIEYKAAVNDIVDLGREVPGGSTLCWTLRRNHSEGYYYHHHYPSNNHRVDSPRNQMQERVNKQKFPRRVSDFADGQYMQELP